MAWTTISDATLEVGKALRALTLRNLRDNITAVANGDAGAPQIQTAAIAANAVTAAKIADNTIPSTRISYPTVGDGYVMRWLRSGTYAASTLTYPDWNDRIASPIRCDVLSYGAVRLRFTHHSPGDLSYSWARILVDGVPYAEWAQIMYNTYIERVFDFAVSPGQQIVVQGHKDPAYPSSGGSNIINARILSNTVSFGVA